jgi:serine/threonine protein phosphatase PrpC
VIASGSTPAHPGAGSVPERRCPDCSTRTVPGAVFCEACGARIRQPDEGADGSSAPQQAGQELPVTLSTRTLMTESDPEVATADCPQCGGTFAADGYCETCGTPRANPRDHVVEQPAAWVAGVCDRGLRHAANEDALALAADADPSGRVVMVVCDGVSNTVNSDVASLAAARAARDVLTARRGQGLGAPAGRDAATAAALRAGAEAARSAVVRLSGDAPDNPPSCTFVAAVVQDGRLAVGSIGDSRAYWLPDAGAALVLTRDDSLAAERIAGGVPRSEAEGGPHSHAITRWLGVDAPGGPPRTSGADVDTAGWVLLCSDGLWNYCSEAADLAALVHRCESAGARGPLELANALVAHANGQGGQDNITVALCRVQGPPDPPERPT